MSPQHRGSLGVLALVAFGGCASDANEPAADQLAPAATSAIDASSSSAGVPGTAAAAALDEQRFPDVLDVVATFDDAATTWTFDVTMSSPYDTPERYADGWRVLGPDGIVYGTHTLTHDHAGEQPFTRRQSGVRIPPDVAEVTVEGRDQRYGFGGRTVSVSLQTGSR